MRKSKKLSNPYSTGGGGAHFEAHVQASFVALMLTGGHAPCLPCWPIAEIKLQGKIDGFDTDDLVVFVENKDSKERRKLLGQVKHSIAITKGSTLFGEVMQAAWNDFQNPKVFTRDKDMIALITGPLSATDENNVQWLLNQARHTATVDEFFRNVHQANFSPSKSAEKLEVIQHHLKAANGGNDVSKDELYDFLNHFHLLGYDLGNEFGVVLSLLHSHISQFRQEYPQWVWSRVVDIVQTWNQDAGTIKPGNLPEDLLDAFKQRAVAKIPEDLKAAQEKPKTDWTRHQDATHLALAVLIGAWQDKNQCDRETITHLLGISYDEWLKKAREILHCPDSPLTLTNGTWKVNNRVELWKLLGSRAIDQDLDKFGSLAGSVLGEANPAFELPIEDRFAASIHGKVLNYSHVLRKGIAEGLAILGSQPESCAHCSPGKAEQTCVLVIRKLLTDADWVLWGSLNDLLPALAEGAPGEFLDAIEKALSADPCPFDELFSQEGSGITGGNYLTGLLWALEGLAWDEQYLVRVCDVLAELANHDPGGSWANRPSNSLVTILLPWMPQTLASVDKRKVAVQTIFKDWPDIAWNLIIQLLPSQHQISSGSHKPSWCMTIPDNLETGVTPQEEYWQQVSFYAELAVTAAGQDAARLSALIDHFDDLPKSAFDQLLQTLASQHVSALPENQRVLIVDHLTKFTNRHRRFSDAKWALPDELLTRIEHVAGQLAPTNPFYLYQHLFTDRGIDLFEENGNWEEQQKKLDARRETAISEIFQQDGTEGIIRFSETVSSPRQVGHALCVIADPVIELTLLPSFLDSSDSKRKNLVNGFVQRRFHLKGWDWCDALDKSDWTPEQVGQFLAWLPFTKDTWDRASEWLQEHERKYWNRTSPNIYEANGDVRVAIDKLIEHGRPHAAINSLGWLHHNKQPIDSNQCIRALLAALSSTDTIDAKDNYHIVELIKFLQKDSSVNQDDLFRIEWAYAQLLYYNGVTPQYLESRLANDPDLFCEMIRLIYRSQKEDLPSGEPSEKSRAVAINAWQLLYKWKTPPGTQQDGTFNENRFTEWLQKVKESCTESGHLEVALIKIGEVLIHTPPDSDGLWIRRTVAAALNDRDADNMRSGYRTGIYNSRGIHSIDPTGKPEKELAERYRSKAEEVENAGFQRFAVTLKDLAKDYDREAEQIIAEHKQESA